MVVIFNEKEKRRSFREKCGKRSLIHVKFEKPEGNANDCIDLSEVTGMKVC